MVIATGAGKLTLHEFIGLVERHPERKYRLDAAGGIVEMSPGWVHGKLQFRIGKLLDRWLERGALPGYAVGTEVLHDLDGWLCIPDVSVLPLVGEPYPRVAPRLAGGLSALVGGVLHRGRDPDGAKAGGPRRPRGDYAHKTSPRLADGDPLRAS